MAWAPAKTALFQKEYEPNRIQNWSDPGPIGPVDGTAAAVNSRPEPLLHTECDQITTMCVSMSVYTDMCGYIHEPAYDVHV